MHRALGAFRGSTLGRYDDLDLPPVHPDVCSHLLPTKRDETEAGVPGLITYAGSGIGALPLLRVCRKVYDIEITGMESQIVDCVTGTASRLKFYTLKEFSHFTI